MQFAYSKITIGNTLKKKEEEKKDKEKKGPDMSDIMNKQLLYFMPLLTVFIGISFPAGLPLYWIVSTLVSIGQYYILELEEKRKEKEA